MCCGKCGQQLREGAKFCNKCGVPVFDEKQKAIVNENFDQSDKESIVSVSERSQSKKHSVSLQKPKKRFPLWLKIVCIVLILGIATGGVILALNLTKTSKSSPKDKAAGTVDSSASITFTELDSMDDLPGDFEKELGLFYYYDSKDKKTLDEHYYEERSNFDCNEPNTYHNYLIESLMPFITPVRLQLYPGENTEPAEKGPDPLDKYSGASFCRVPYEKIVWIAQNIFHIPQDEIEDMITYACENTDIYIYEEADKKYLINRYEGSDGFNAEKQYKKILTDGTKYYLLIEYNFDKTKSLPTEDYYVEASYESIDGKDYWTLYRHTLDVPDSMKELMMISGDVKSQNTKQEESDTPNKATEEPTQALTVDDYIEVYSQGSFYHEKHKDNVEYSLPLLKVDSDDAEAFNAEMKAKYDDFLEKVSNAQPVDYMDLPIGISYQASLNDSILSLCITRNNGLNNFNFFVVNIDVSTGKQLRNEDVLGYLNVTFDNIREDIRTSLKAEYMEEYGAAYEKMDNSTKEYCDKSFSDENINKVSLFLLSDKSLYGAFPINYMYQSGWNECVARINY